MELTSSQQLTGINPLYGFDPIELLKKTHFPNDENEYQIRHSRQARLAAIRKCNDPELKVTKKVTIFSPGLQQPDALPMETVQLQQTNRIQQLQLARSAAALMIQSLFRGYATRKRYIIIINHLVSIKTKRDEIPIDNQLPTVKDLQIQEKLRKKFLLYCNYYEKLNLLPPEYSHFCAAVIQSAWRRFVLYRVYKRYRNTTRRTSLVPVEEHEQEQALHFLTSFVPKVASDDQLFTDAALVIQRAWKRYYNKCIYRFYKDLIKVRESADPYQMLKFINPKEAHLIDKSLSLHIRFRLGGDHFPPTIFYKIFLHRNMVDLNAFAPRDYTSQLSKQVLPSRLFSKDPLPIKSERGIFVSSDEWYSRSDLNNWRPVIENPTRFPNNYVVVMEKKKEPFHYSQLKRKEELIKKKKQRQLEWMKKLYDIGKRGESENGFLDLQKGLDVDIESNPPIPNRRKNTKKPLQQVEEELNQILMDLEQDHNVSLISWTRALDFDEYHSSWLGLASTAPSDIPQEYKKFQLGQCLDSYETEMKQAELNEFDIPSEKECDFDQQSVDNLFLQQEITM